MLDPILWRYTSARAAELLLTRVGAQRHRIPIRDSHLTDSDQRDNQWRSDVE
jgi:hypothetical protein